MRFAIPVVLLFAALAPAAPVPDSVKTERKRLEALWVDMLATAPVERARAVYELLDRPQGVDFLAEKLGPVEASADQLKGWLRNLNSDDEREWRPAVERLEYIPPQTRLTPVEQLDLVDTDEGKRRLLLLWMPGLLSDGPSEKVHDVRVTPQGKRFECEYRLGAENDARKFDVPTPADWFSPAWNRAALAAHVLHRADTDDTRAALKRLAGGHPDTRPTTTAAALLTAKVPKPAASFTDAHWNHLLSGSMEEVVDAVIALRTATDVPKVLKSKLPAIKATEEQVTEWLKALDWGNVEEQEAAFAELCYFRPSLALSLQQQFDLMTTANGRWLLFQLWWRDYDRAPAQMKELRIEDKFEVTDTGLRQTITSGTKTATLEARVSELRQQTCRHWQRARLAILALEHIGTADAKAVLKQLADGHPDIQPTREAKAALERLK